MNGRIEERAGLVDFNHPASLHDRDFVAVMGGNAKIGGYDQLRRPGFARQFFHQIEDLALNGYIESGGRRVGGQQARSVLR